MSYRDDLEAAHQRIHTLEQEKEALLSEKPPKPRPKQASEGQWIIAFWISLGVACPLFHSILVRQGRLDPSTSTKSCFYVLFWLAGIVIRIILHYILKKEEEAS